MHSPAELFSRDVFLRSQARSNCKQLEPSRASSGLKLKRRHVNLTLADIQLAKIVVCEPAAPLRSASPGCNSDLEFSVSDCSESPVPSLSSSSSTSPETQSSSLPTTPSSADSFHQSLFRPVTIKPLVINKHVRVSSTLPAPKCPLPCPPMPQDDSDSDSDSEWYSRELSKIVTLRSSTQPDLRSKPRPDSMCISETSARKSSSRPSLARRHNKSVPMSPKRVPTTPPSRATFLPFAHLRRPPPRSSIPADVDDTFTFDDDDTDSAFSFSLSDRSPLSPQSAASQRSFQSPCPSPFPPSFPSTAVEQEFDFDVKDLHFDINSPPMQPLDIPVSPVDIEADPTPHTELRETSSTPQPAVHREPEPGTGDDDAWECGRELRSRWSSSTLGSVRVEHSRRSAIGVALRAYFASPGVKPKTHVGRGGGSPVRRAGSDPIPRQREVTREDVMVIGYGQ